MRTFNLIRCGAHLDTASRVAEIRRLLMTSKPRRHQPKRFNDLRRGI